MRAGEDVPKVTADGAAAEQLAMFVPIMAPWIHGAGCKNFRDLPAGMISPDPAAERESLSIRGAWFSDRTWRRGAAATVQPTVGSPMQAVGKIVIIDGRYVEAIEHDFRGAVGNAVVVAIGKE